MRNALFAATALIGVSVLGIIAAHAQQATEPPITTDSFASGLATGATLAPGSITVRLRAQLWVEMSYGTDSGSKTATGKNSGVLLGSYVRLYPKFDAKAANGLEYGATAEIRMNSGTGAGTSTANTLYFRRYNGYVGTPTAGRLYFGPENSAIGRLSAGTTMEDFDYNGGFNGDVPSAISGSTLVNYATLRSSQWYTTNKLVYISPAFAGFTIGGSYEPSQSAGEAAITSGGSLNPTSASLANGTNLTGMRRNTVDVAAQYKGSIGPAALSAFVGYVHAGHVDDSTATAATAQYRDLSVVATGARLTIGQFSMGGNFNTGSLDGNGNGGLLRQGQRNGQNIVAGAQYIMGPVIVGFQYLNENTGGFYSSNSLYTKSQLHDTGIVVGGAWDYAPGATMYVSALYDQRHQFGYNFVANATNSSVGNSVQGRAIQIGNTFRW